MSDCELCGRIRSAQFMVSLDGVTLNVCSNCSGHGVFVSKIPQKPRYKDVREKQLQVKDVETEIDLVDDYSPLIRAARENLGLTIEQFAGKLNEKANLLKKIEQGKMTPTEKLGKKLEKFLGSSLFQKIKLQDIGTKKPDSKALKIGDIVTIKKGRIT